MKNEENIQERKCTEREPDTEKYPAIDKRPRKAIQTNTENN